MNDLSDGVELSKVIEDYDPQIIVNCLSTKKDQQQDWSSTLSIYSYIPRMLDQFTHDKSTRIITLSSDAIFSGRLGSYTESDIPDDESVYGRSKFLGEISGKSRVTIRTSMIGHSLFANEGLLDWLLKQKSSCNGYVDYMFSGLTTVQIAKFLRDVLIPRNDINGVYNLAAERISKYDLLQLINEIYELGLTINKQPGDFVDRSLNPDKLYKSTGYKAPEWHTMIEEMRQDYRENILGV